MSVLAGEELRTAEVKGSHGKEEPQSWGQASAFLLMASSLGEKVFLFFIVIIFNFLF